MGKEVFISHSSKNYKEAKKICDCLEEKNISCFIAPRDLVPGRIYGEEIVRGIDECDKFILIASKDAFESQHVLREVERAVNRNMKMYVYKIEDVEVPKSFEYFIMISQWIDASFASRINELAEIIKAEEDNKTEDSKNVISNSENKILRLAGRNKYITISVAVVIIVCMIVSAIIFTKDKSDKKPYENVNNNSEAENISDTGSKADIADKNNAKQDNAIKECKVGDIITMGKYNDIPIEWVVLNIDDNGNAYVLAKDIISIKAYDSAESGEWNKIDEHTTYEREKESEYSKEQLINAKGSNSWTDSNIRIWLNSNEKKVTYEKNLPDGKSFYDSRISYDKEEGFLNAFTSEELDEIVMKNGDYVFLPSKEEIENYVVKGEIIFPEADVTKEALEADRTGEISSLVNEYGGKFPYFTRTASEECCYKVVCVFSDDYSNDGTPYFTDGVGTPRGIRPAMIIKTS